MTTLEEFKGREIGVSDVGRGRPEADRRVRRCTGDRQWIHVDVERARRESPYGGTIAHGYLTLSLAASLTIEAGVIPSDAGAALNYGLDKVRFIAPVRAGARVRNRVVLIAVENKPDGRVLLTLGNTIEIDGETKPALVAESLAMLMRASGDITRTERDTTMTTATTSRRAAPDAANDSGDPSRAATRDGDALGESASQHTLAANPLIGIRRKEVIGAATALVRELAQAAANGIA